MVWKLPEKREAQRAPEQTHLQDAQESFDKKSRALNAVFTGISNTNENILDRREEVAAAAINDSIRTFETMASQKEYWDTGGDCFSRYRRIQVRHNSQGVG